MSSGKRKYPPWIDWFLKLLILGIALAVIITRLNSTPYEGVFTYTWNHSELILPIFALLWFLNLVLDARIWQKVHRFISSISLRKALKTNLVCYTLAFITPVNSGELAGRYLMLESQAYRRKTVFLTFWSHLPRLAVKLILGGFAFIFFVESESNAYLKWIAGTLMLLVFIGYFLFIHIQQWLSKHGWRKLKLEDYLIKDRPKFLEKLDLLALATIKFLTYNLQFLLLLMMWGNLSLSMDLLVPVIATYVLGAMIPTLPMVDFVVKAGIAFAIFDPNLVSESILLNAALTTWLFNLAIPALAGGIIILRTDLRSSLRKKPLPDSQYDS